MGFITTSSKTCIYRVRSLADIRNIILPHFDNFPLITAKSVDYLLFKKAINMMVNKEHLNKEGINNFMKIRVSMNKGRELLSDENLSVFFPNLTPFPREVREIPLPVPHESWMAGFTAGEGSFMVNIGKSPNTKSGF